MPNFQPPPGPPPNWQSGLRSQEDLKERGLREYQLQCETRDPGKQAYDPVNHDSIIVAIDFENLCLAMTGEYPDREQYQYRPISEASIAYIDTRQIRTKGWAPGMRARDLHKHMTS
ncbi:hypothetical protein FALBO_12712 [Fusarium albosuccineum]|uniref:Uncharacterized protein n=1 Tax=Fusarium albosuccineum TaxID=1237068 RepID=A0A8H4L2I1_9HYPO|nr:hypothetical protein FALBO_12712 [Fusarium albosuccineum]